MATWTIDSAHSEIGFKVRHLVISNVSGKFTSFEGKLESSKEDFTDAKISFSADVNSIHTGNDQRDGHLKSPDFFDAANNPTISFVSTGITLEGGSDYKITGNLTMKGITKPVVLNAELGGIQKNLQGQTVAGFEINGKLNRKEFGLEWGGVTEAGTIAVGEEVKLHINVELVKG